MKSFWTLKYIQWLCWVCLNLNYAVKYEYPDWIFWIKRSFWLWMGFCIMRQQTQIFSVSLISSYEILNHHNSSHLSTILRLLQSCRQSCRRFWRNTLNKLDLLRSLLFLEISPIFVENLLSLAILSDWIDFKTDTLSN